MVSLKKFLKNRNYEEIAAVAHKIKGSSALYGFCYLAELAESLKKFALAKNYTEIEKYLAEIKQYLATVKYQKKT